MAKFTCPRCRNSFSASASAPAARVRCPHCQQAVALPKTSATRWFYAQGKKKYGPYNWHQLLTLARHGKLGPDDMLLQEGTKQWVRAGSMPALFAGIAPPAPIAPTTAERKVPAQPASRPFPWLIAGLASAGVSVLIGLGIVGYLVFLRNPAVDAQPKKPDLVAEKKKNDPPKTPADPPKKETAKSDDPPKNVKEENKTPEEKRLREAWAEQFIERLNRHRKSAGLGTVTLDADLSRGCLERMKYLAQQANPDKVEPSEHHLAAFSAPLDALDRWLGRVASRAALLAPEIHTVGLAFEQTGPGDWISVVDPVRGQGDTIVVFPAPKQTDVPLSFTGGPEVPDDKAAAGFPITVTFPPTRQVTDAKIELRDKANKLVDGWTWTPQKPVRPGSQRNTIAVIPKGLLQSGSAYQVKASAQIDGKAWELAWSFTTEDDSDTRGVWARKAVAKVNGYRGKAGLNPVALDEKLSRGCLAHARYLVINEGKPELDGLKAHDEFPNLPGYSIEGREAGKASDIAIGDNEPLDGVDAWMATLYHRVPLLEPNLKTIGFGCARGRRQGWVTVMNVTKGRTDKARPGIVFYPAPDQPDVALSFPNGGEEPNPIPNDKTGRAGFPITVFFPHNQPLKNAAARLTDAKGAEVPCWFSSPDKPANADFPAQQGNTVCLIPKAPLAANTVYRVHFQGHRAGQPWDKTWQFTTGSGGLSPADATRTVLERLNEYRAQAGLGAVTLDEALSRGCQFHAEYLVKNTEILLKKNAPVNDEDPDLPGFTRDGLRAALQSDVFTNAPVPVTQIDDLMATFTRRVFLLDPNLQRIGFGCSHDRGRGWRCVLDTVGGRSESHIVLYPGPKQDDVPTVGLDAVKDINGKPGFPITVTFPRQTKLRNADAVLKDAQGKSVDVVVTVPEQASRIVAVYPRAALQTGRTYAVTVSVIANGAEWRQEWQFTTK
jgi:uncharacterized protein YkwD